MLEGLVDCIKLQPHVFSSRIDDDVSEPTIWFGYGQGFSVVIHRVNCELLSTIRTKLLLPWAVKSTPGVTSSGHEILIKCLSVKRFFSAFILTCHSRKGTVVINDIN